MEPNWDWPNLENWLAEAMWSSILDAEQNLNSLNLFTGLWSLSLPTPFPTHPWKHSALGVAFLTREAKLSFNVVHGKFSWFSFSSPPRLEKDISPTKIRYNNSAHLWTVLFNLQGSNPTIAISCVSLW